MKTTMKIIAIATTLGLAFTFSVSAGDEEGKKKRPEGKGQRGRMPSPEQMIKKLDKDGNGTLSLEEFKKGKGAQKKPDRAEQFFKKMDADKDGQLTKDEITEARKKMRQRRGKGGKDGDRPHHKKGEGHGHKGGKGGGKGGDGGGS